jgi:CheY-like chemotaxis protein
MTNKPHNDAILDEALCRAVGEVFAGCGVPLESLAAGSGRVRLPILMLTTEAAPSLVDRAKKAGAKGWIVKPFKPELLLGAVRKLTAA